MRSGTAVVVTFGAAQSLGAGESRMDTLEGRMRVMECRMDSMHRLLQKIAAHVGLEE